ncbi:unnamed protein product, partial [Closterium sp. NIES-53]
PLLTALHSSAHPAARAAELQLILRRPRAFHVLSIPNTSPLVPSRHTPLLTALHSSTNPAALPTEAQLILRLPRALHELGVLLTLPRPRPIATVHSSSPHSTPHRTPILLTALHSSSEHPTALPTEAQLILHLPHALHELGVPLALPRPRPVATVHSSSPHSTPPHHTPVLLSTPHSSSDRTPAHTASSPCPS